MFGALRRPRRAPVRMLVAAITGIAVIAAGAGTASASWTYERVTPVDKDGGSVRVGDTFRAAPDGSALLYSSTGSFNGVPAASSPQYVRYLAQRGHMGWTNTAVDPPWDMGNLTITIMLTVGSSENLEWLVQTSTLALTPGAHPGGSNLYVRNTRTGQLYLAATTPNRNDFTNGLSSSQGAQAIRFVGNDGLVFFGSFGGAELMPSEAPGATAYRWTPQTGLEALGRMPALDGSGYYPGGMGHSSGENGVLRPIPPGSVGQRAYFRAGVNNAVYLLGATGATPMTPVSRDRTAANLGTMRSAHIAGTSEDGRYVVIQLSGANEKLTDDTPTLPGTSRYIYRYDSETDELDFVGAASNAQLQTAGSGVQWVSRDGKTVLYQSTAVHAPDAVNGQPNLYVWRENEGVKLVATVDVGAGAFWRAASPNGRYFAFTTHLESLAQRFGYDNRSLGCSTTASPVPCKMVYRYDIEEDQLDCASCRPDGDPPSAQTGTALISSPGTQRMDARIPQHVADDGTVFFDSQDPLVASDLNGEYDVYAWRDGDLQLVSRATPGLISRFIDATPDGRTVFFATADRIVPSDTDWSYDIYAARLDGGFIEEGDGLPSQCVGPDCRQSVSPPSALPAIGSVSFGGDGNVPLVRDPARVSVGVSRLKAATGSVARLSVRVPAAGRISVAGVRVGRVARAVPRAGSYLVRVALKPRVRERLRRSNRQRLRVNVRVSYRARGGQSASRTIAVTFGQPSAKQAKVKKGGR